VSTPAPTSAAAFSRSIRPVPHADLGQGHEHGQRRRRHHGSLCALAPAQHASVHQQRRQTADREHPQEEQDDAQRGLAHGVQVEAHPRVHEEDRDEEPVTDGVQLGVQDGRGPSRPAAENDAGEEGAEHGVQVDPAGDGDQHEQQQDRSAQRDLGGLVLAAGDDRGQPAPGPHQP
jgi:hypothetical protein